MENKEIEIRHFVENDIPELLRLMKELARFEDYIDQFCVTEKDIFQRGLCENQFYALVAAQKKSHKLLGMAVLYIIPYTFTLKPNLVLKELYVDSSARGFGVGEKLFNSAVDFGRSMDCQQLLWTVMDGNKKAETFYSKKGAKKDLKWQNWSYEF